MRRLVKIKSSSPRLSFDALLAGGTNTMHVSLVLGQQTTGLQSPIIGFLPIVLIAAIFYLLVFRPMKTRQKKLDNMIANLKSGDRVITSGGIYGTIASVKEKTFLLRVSDQVRIEIAKNAIASLQSEENP